MDQKENIQNEKVSEGAAGQVDKEPVVTVVEARSQDNIDIARTAKQWIRWN